MLVWSSQASDLGLVPYTGSVVGTDSVVWVVEDEEPWDDQFERVTGIVAYDIAARIWTDLHETKQARLDGMKHWGGTYCLGSRSD